MKHSKSSSTNGNFWQTNLCKVFMFCWRVGKLYVCKSAHPFLWMFKKFTYIRQTFICIPLQMQTDSQTLQTAWVKHLNITDNIKRIKHCHDHHTVNIVHTDDINRRADRIRKITVLYKRLSGVVIFNLSSLQNTIFRDLNYNNSCL